MKYYVDKDVMTNIADKIREKTDTTELMSPAEMTAKIDSIETPTAETYYDECLDKYYKDEVIIKGQPVQAKLWWSIIGAEGYDFTPMVEANINNGVGGCYDLAGETLYEENGRPLQFYSDGTFDHFMPCCLERGRYDKVLFHEKGIIDANGDYTSSGALKSDGTQVPLNKVIFKGTDGTLAVPKIKILDNTFYTSSSSGGNLNIRNFFIDTDVNSYIFDENGRRVSVVQSLKIDQVNITKPIIIFGEQDNYHVANSGIIDEEGNYNTYSEENLVAAVEALGYTVTK